MPTISSWNGACPEVAETRVTETLPPPPPRGSMFFDAMSQIGLKLEQRKRPLSVIVIDHVERVPTAN